MDGRYEKFTVSRQEPLWLSIAMEEFFKPETEAGAREAYGQYLNRRRSLKKMG